MKISAQAQINFADVCFFLVHQVKQVNLVATHEIVTLAAVKKMKTQRQQEHAHKDPTVIPVIDFKNWPKSMELFDQYVGGHQGVDGGPLRYVARCDLFWSTALVDPGFNTGGSKYNDHDDEIIA